MAPQPLPELDGERLQQLQAFVSQFRDDFARAEQVQWAGVYLQGLLGPSERKSIEPLARSVRLPEGLSVADPPQALQNFINQSPWDEQRIWRRWRAYLAEVLANRPGIWVISDLTFKKRGRRSVGVHRQYSHATGGKINCQSAIAVHFVDRQAAWPLAVRLYLPGNWSGDPERLRAAGVPPTVGGPARKWQIALELLDEVLPTGLSGQALGAGISFGPAEGFRAGLTARGLSWLVEVSGSDSLTGEAEDVPIAPRPTEAVRDRAVQAVLRDLAQPGSGGESPCRRYAWVRPSEPGEAPRILVVEPAHGPRRYLLALIPGHAPCRQALRLWQAHRQTEASCDWMRQNLGLDHFEGRSWRGFHHHMRLAMLAYGFCMLNP
jgi:SRSO17 transposase